MKTRTVTIRIFYPEGTSFERCLEIEQQLRDCFKRYNFNLGQGVEIKREENEEIEEKEETEGRISRLLSSLVASSFAFLYSPPDFLLIVMLTMSFIFYFVSIIFLFY